MPRTKEGTPFFAQASCRRLCGEARKRGTLGLAGDGARTRPSSPGSLRPAVGAPEPGADTIGGGLPWPGRGGDARENVPEGAAPAASSSRSTLRRAGGVPAPSLLSLYVPRPVRAPHATSRPPLSSLLTRRNTRGLRSPLRHIHARPAPHHTPRPGPPPPPNEAWPRRPTHRLARAAPAPPQPPPPAAPRAPPRRPAPPRVTPR